MAKFKDLEKIFKDRCVSHGVKLGVDKLKPKIKTRWIAALTSGEYPQTTGMLRSKETEDDAGGFCCLGVLAHTFKRTTAFKEDFGNEDGLNGSCTLGYSMQDYTGLNSNLADVLINMNDSADANFKQIAKLIDKYL